MKTNMIMIILVLVMTTPTLSFALSVGDKAPGFEAMSTHGNLILSEFEGKRNVVLALYYADFTRV